MMDCTVLVTLDGRIIQILRVSEDFSLPEEGETVDIDHTTTIGGVEYPSAKGTQRYEVIGTHLGADGRTYYKRHKHLGAIQVQVIEEEVAEA